jgi:hypothetical protein
LKSIQDSPESLFRRLLSSGPKAELLALFHRNPGLIDTIDGIAIKLGRSSDAIKADIYDLVDIEILNRKVIGRAEVFYLNRENDRRAQEAMAAYLKGLGEKK